MVRRIVGGGFKHVAALRTHSAKKKGGSQGAREGDVGIRIRYYNSWKEDAERKTKKVKNGPLEDKMGGGYFYSNKLYTPLSEVKSFDS